MVCINSTQAFVLTLFTPKYHKVWNRVECIFPTEGRSLSMSPQLNPNSITSWLEISSLHKKVRTKKYRKIRLWYIITQNTHNDARQALSQQVKRVNTDHFPMWMEDKWWDYAIKTTGCDQTDRQHLGLMQWALKLCPAQISSVRQNAALMLGCAHRPEMDWVIKWGNLGVCEEAKVVWVKEAKEKLDREGRSRWHVGKHWNSNHLLPFCHRLWTLTYKWKADTCTTLCPFSG